ncbi:MAG TPA: xanthine dehydrogenase family protein subunit M [Capsulimonadaceae bacterium]|nr:xanthine dehydrogenase family protein subunit M [Capsulimonadaceae bacterium]
MHPFEYNRAKDPNNAISEAAKNAGVRYLAGGTTLIDLMKLDVETPPSLIDINLVPLAEITELRDGTVRVGALVRNSDMANHPLIAKRYPVIAQAILAGASPQIRNMATTGGNLLQRTRCYYFRDTAMPCNKRVPGSGCSAIDGYNRIHAVLGTSDHCIAAHPSDLCVALAAMDATVQVQGPKGTRSIKFTDFHLLPGDHPERETVLEPGELIAAVDIPKLPWATHSRYLKVRDRASYAFALASAAVALDIQGGMIRDARVALGGVGTKPWRSHEAEKALVGQPAGRATYQAAASQALAGAKTYSHNAFKVELAKRTLARALSTVG